MNCREGSRRPKEQERTVGVICHTSSIWGAGPEAEVMGTFK